MEVKKPKRIVLKLSGESLKGKLEFGLDSEIIKAIATEIKKISKINVQVSIVAGGGNFWRGVEFEKRGMDRSTADYAGMLATIMNALALQDELEKTKSKFEHNLHLIYLLSLKLTLEEERLDI